jgi:hypothetical protein
MPYCRFFWTYLLEVGRAQADGSTLSHLARHLWHVGRRVIGRAKALLEIITLWVEQLHRELTDGEAARELGLMVKIITAKLGRRELVNRWYRHRYPRRFFDKTGRHTI